jgi:hypothetical protein
MGTVKRLQIKVAVKTPKGNETKCIDFVKDGCTTFFNAQHLLLQLHAGERALYDFLLEKMIKKDNTITIDTALKNSFITHIAKITSNKTSYTLQSIGNYVKQLEALGLIIKMGSINSGFYSVNPKYAFKGTEKNRAATLKSLIEDRNNLGLPTNILAPF